MCCNKWRKRSGDNSMVKNAYTLMEACVVMLIVSIFVAVIANVVPHKVSPKIESDTHGRFECYWKGNKLYQKQVSLQNQNEAPVEVTGNCSFTPPNIAKYVVLNVVGGGATNGSCGKFVSTFYPGSNVTYVIVPGKAQADVGNSTKIYQDEQTESKLILDVDGGTNISGNEGKYRTSINDVMSCVAQRGPQNYDGDYYDCSKAPTCEIEGDRIKVGFCRTNEIYSTKFLPWNSKAENKPQMERELLDDQFVVNKHTTWNPATGEMTYYDASLHTDYKKDPDLSWEPTTNTTQPALYQLNLKLKVPTENGDISVMTKYFDMLKINDEMSGVKPGNGGCSGDCGNGGVLIVW